MTTVDSSIEAYPTVHGLSTALVDGVLSITMNRPDSLNALTEAMMTGIADTVERAGSDERVRVVRLGGAGRGFSSGAGISEDDQKSGGGSSATTIIDEANRAVPSISALPKTDLRRRRRPPAGVARSM